MLYDVILPLRLQGALTYSASVAGPKELKRGTRVLVPFRKNKVITGIIFGESEKIPVGIVPREILAVADEIPFVDEKTLKLWEWIADYYMCTVGEVMSAAIPAVLRPHGDMLLKKNDEPLNEFGESVLVTDMFAGESHLNIASAYHFLNKKSHPPSLIYTWLQSGILQWDDSNISWGSYKTRGVIEINPTIANDEEKLGALLDLLDKKSPSQSMVLMLVLNQFFAGLPAYRDELKQLENYNDAALQALIKKGVLISAKAQTAIQVLEPPKINEINLSAAQEEAFQAIKSAFKSSKPTLLHGITGSGKTEIYLRLCQEAIASDRQVLFLMPEIALTQQMISRVQKALGNCVLVMHSDISDKEKTEQWQQIKSGQAKLILGARSALFSPFANLGLIIIDEEHEAAYKQKEPAPRYHARDAAVVLAGLYGANVVMGSATPSLETYTNTERGKYALVNLTERFDNMKLPAIHVIDMRESLRKKEAVSGFSRELMDTISLQMEHGRQAILFRNRKGYAPHVQCRQCGWAARCRNCDISLPYFKNRNINKCHLCGYTISAYLNCPSCHADALTIKGTGTERIEERFEDLFPQQKTVRMDSESSGSRLRRQRIISDFERGLTDVMIGTQILAKGFDFKGVGLVAILEADGLWSFPDFRANERAFQLMIQVAGRAGRSQQQGVVLLQTLTPDYPLLRYVTSNDYKGFYDTELQQRRMTCYPPFNRLIHIRLRFRERNLCHEAAEKLRSMIVKDIPSTSDAIVPGIERMRNHYHREILIKLPLDKKLVNNKSKLLQTLHHFRELKAYSQVNVLTDVDPYF